jgi:hypothetical protein
MTRIKKYIARHREQTSRQRFQTFKKLQLFLPEQLNPFPVYPVRQEQSNDPGELAQSAFGLQGACKHSLISE